MHDHNTIVLSVGGSLVFPKGGLDVEFLGSLNNFVRKNVARGKKFFLVVGGGSVTRQYQKAALDVTGTLQPEDIDWLGIHVTRLNAHLVRSLLKDIAHPRIIENYEHKLDEWIEPVVVGSGWKPGWSTDYCAVTLAKDYGAKMVVNLSNIYYLYDKDPHKHEDAKPLERLTWKKVRELVGTEWIPGSNVPFDPVASALAQEIGLQVIITKGNDFENLEHILNGLPFKGSIIDPDLL